MTTPVFENIPDALKALPQFVIWKYEPRDGRQTKVPKCLKTGRTADAQNPANRGSFAEAVAAYKKFGASGIGFVVTPESGLVMGDLDHCRDKATGRIEDWAQAYVDSVGTYTEITPSGEGLRFVAQGSLPPSGRKRGNVELYDSKRFLTLTGNHLPGTPREICSRTLELHRLHEQVFGAKLIPASAPHANSLPDDTALLEKARRAKNGAKFARLWAGDTSDYNNDASRADMGLLHCLAFFTGPDAARIDRLFRQSGLYREKWDEKRGGQTYGERTIEKVLSRKTEYYNPARPVPARSLSTCDEGESEEVEPDPFGMSVTVCKEFTHLETELQRLGAISLYCGLILPPDMDREAIEKVGSLLRNADDHVTTLLNFLWGDWYCGLPTVKGAKIKIVANLYGGADSLKALNEQKRLSELAHIARQIPQANRQHTRPWSFYEKLARLPKERWEYWLNQRPRRGLLSEMDAEIHVAREPAPSHQRVLSQEEVLPSTLPLSPSPVIVYAPKDCLPVSLSEGETAAERGTVLLSVSESMARLLNDLKRRAEQAGKTSEEYLRNFLYGANTEDILPDLVDKQVDNLSEISERLPSTYSTKAELAPVLCAITAEQKQQARQVAEVRKAGHDHCRRPEEDNGSHEANRRCDYYGALSEILIGDWLPSNCINSALTLIANRPVSRPDLTLFGKRVDVKSSPPGSNFLCINEAKHQRERGTCAFYLPVCFSDENTAQIMAPVSYEEVDTWRLMTNGHSPYRSQRRECLKQLYSFEELRRRLCEQEEER